jgi:hypothetical protein
MTLLGHRNTATTKKLDFKNSHLTSVGATWRVGIDGRSYAAALAQVSTIITSPAPAAKNSA